MLNPHFRDMLSAFIEGDVEFLIVGAYALSAHGLPRATGDLDFWIRRTSANAERVLRALRRFGAPVAEITAADLNQPDVVVQIGLEPSRIDILTEIDGVAFESAWTRRMVIEVDGLSIPVLSLDHLLDNKRAVGRPQDVADVAAIEAEQERRRQSANEC